MTSQNWRLPVKSSSSLKQSTEQPSLQVRTYVAALPADVRGHVQALGQAIRAAAPGAVESFSYGMPAFALDGKPFVWYAAWKNHSSFYPLSKVTGRSLAAELEQYEISGKGDHSVSTRPAATNSSCEASCQGTYRRVAKKAAERTRKKI